MMRTRQRHIGMVIVLAALLAGCDTTPSTPEPVTGSFVGRMGTTETFVAIVNDGAEVRAYVCDGTPDREATMSYWFKGTQSAGGFDLPSMSGSARLVASFSSGGASGRIEIPGQPADSFTIARAEEPAGFYLFKKLIGDELYWAGWIILPSGERRGSMASPTRTSLGVELDPATGSALLPGGQSVRPGRLTTTNLRAGMCGPPLCGGFP